ncbi:hypothetical protein [Streptomonospora sediminis]
MQRPTPPGAAPTPPGRRRRGARVVGGRLSTGQTRRARRTVRGLEPWTAYYAAEHLAAHGRGPTWRELEAIFGWNRWDGALAITFLIEQRWLRREEEGGSRLLPGRLAGGD